MNYTDEQLQKALVKFLPDELMWNLGKLYWKARTQPDTVCRAVFPTELDYLCLRAEKKILPPERDDYLVYLGSEVNKIRRMATTAWLCKTATWNQRVAALVRHGKIVVEPLPKKYAIENFGKGVIVADYSGKRGANGAAFAGKHGIWQDQPVGIEPFNDVQTATAFAEVEVS